MRVLLGLCCALPVLLLACGGDDLPDGEARDLVQRYNRIVAEAYRSADPELVEAVAGPEEARKLLGLIGVKSDLGIVLDSSLERIEFGGSRRDGASVFLATTEVWSYRDRRIGSGEQVGDSSRDRYSLEYELRMFDGRWKVARTRFTTQPEVGRDSAPNVAPVEAMHGGGRKPADGAPSPEKGSENE